jgi:hypothetical protein
LRLPGRFGNERPRKYLGGIFSLRRSLSGKE